MGRIIVVTSGKGGVGKTTVCANIGVCLSCTGARVALVDADNGLCNLDSVLGLENEIFYTIADVILDKCRLKQALVGDKRFPGLYILGAARRYDPYLVTKEKMINLCRELSKEYDYVFIDSPGGIEQGFEVAVSAAEEAIIVTTPDICAVRDADRVIYALCEKNMASISMILNKADLAMMRSKRSMNIQDVMDILCIPLAGVIPASKEVLIHNNLGTVVAAKNFEVSRAFEDAAEHVALCTKAEAKNFEKKGMLEKVLGTFGI